MSKRHRQSVKASKRKRQEARHPRRRAAYLPYVIVVAVAGALVAALFVVTLGGSGTEDVEAAYPVGYTPPVQGDPDAPVELVMWGDFQCPFCKRFEVETLPRIRSEYVDTGKVKLVWRNFEHYGRESEDAAVAAYCAGEQGQFWEYHDTLYRVQGGINSGAFSPPRLIQLAQEHQLDIASFEACQSQFKYDAVLSADYNRGISQGVTGTPGFFVNDEYISGAQPFEVFASVIDNELIAAGP
ncbi:MAG: DsbA family protein [Chloroflexi bacterium]|nr:DsbA family protein [Chloroflexota bacterium]